MSFTPAPPQTLYLWSLITSDGAGFMKDQPCQLPPAARRELVAGGLLEETFRPHPDSNRRATFHTVTDHGWAWAAGHCDAPLPTRSAKAAAVLGQLLRVIDRYLQAQSLSLAELFATPPDAPDTDASRVAAAARELAAGRANVRIRLAALRARLADMPRAALDASLLRLQQDGLLALMPLDDPREIGADDAAAALRVGAAGARHILYLRG